MMTMQRMMIVALGCCTLLASSTQVTADEQLTPMAEKVEAFIDKLMNVRLWNQQLSKSSTDTSKMEVNDLVIANHNLYCASGAALKDQNCQLSDPSLENAEIQISSILSVPTIPDDGDRGRDWAAQVFARNMVSSNPLKFNDFSVGEVTKGSETYDADKASQYATGLIAAAIMSVPTMTFAELYASRKLNDYQDVQNPEPKPASLIAYMEQISNRLRDNKWVDEVLKSKDAIVLQKKQVIMQAEELFLLAHQYKQNERIAALLATLVVQNQKQAEMAASLLSQSRPPASARGGAVTP